ncbi:rotamase [Rhizobium sp. CRIBSB]|nr:rotamase [Rhizobium sp. CRIBSB]
MISHFRNFAKSKWAIGLLAVLALGLLVTGGSQVDVFAALGPKNVITAGERSVNQQTFASDFDRVKKSFEERAGRALTLDELIAENVHLRYLDDATRRFGFLNWAWKVGIRPGTDLVLKRIRETPAFFNEITGQFDEQKYNELLAQQNATPELLEQEFRDQYVTDHFGAALFAGARLPRIYGALVANQALESRDARWFTLTQDSVGAAPAPTDAQLTAFMNENAAQLRRPELRVVTLVVFSNPADATEATVSDAKIEERFNFRRDQLSIPERRTFVTLTAPSKAVADRIAAALRAGQSPAEAGRANGGVQPADYADTPRSALSDPAVAGAVFGLSTDQVSDPVQARVGFVVARVTAITPAVPATLESVRPQIIEELRSEEVRARTFARVENYEKARSSGRTLEQAAQDIGARIIKLPPFSEEGQTLEGQLNAPPQVLTTAWNLTRGGESEVVDAGQGQYFVLRVDEVRPAAMPALAEVRGVLAPQWTLRENNRRLTARAEELAGRIRAGEDIAAVATSVGATLTTRPGIQQNQTSQEAIGQGVLRAVFSQGRGQAFTAPISETAVAVGRIDQVRAPVAALAAPIAERVRPQMTQELVQALGDTAVRAAADASKARYDIGAARLALGLSAEPETPATPAQ